MRSFSFTKADRLLKRSEFLQLAQHGKKISDAHFIIISRPGRFDRLRLGITVTRKVGNAVTRNRIKRFSREFFRLNRHRIKGYWDLNVIAKKEAARLTSAQTFLSLQHLFHRIEAFCRFPDSFKSLFCSRSGDIRLRFHHSCALPVVFTRPARVMPMKWFHVMVYLRVCFWPLSVF